MKTYKRIGTGLVLLSLIATGLVLFSTHKIALAAFGTTGSGGGGSLTPADFDNATYKFITISGVAEISGTIGGQTIQFIDKNPLDNGSLGKANYKPNDSTDFCSNTVLGAGGSKGITLLADFSTVSQGSLQAGVDYDYKDAAGNCQTYTNTLTFTKQADGSFTAQETPAGSAGSSGASTSKGTSCASNSTSSFSWIMCPVLELMDDAAGQFNSFVEGQLCFSTGPTSSTNGVVCGGNNNLNNGVKRAWTVFRNIATALLVIVMLVMVISQAIGGSIFDAYAVRKMLPRLVAAVILMQLSWVLFKWTIDLSNDLGTGIKQLMFAPFGGPDKFSLQNLVGANLSNNSSVANGGYAFLALFAAGLAGVILSIPGLLLMGLYMVLALLTAFIVLVFRKLLIVLLIILAPIALVAWILPGTERYWKLWHTNFTKLLLMFPMIMGLIAAGRIFAGITAGTAGVIMLPHLSIAHLGPIPVPYFGSITNFADFAIIIAAYFGPFFLLPQTFKWGGAAMGAAGKGIANMTERAGKPAKEYLDWRKGLSPWKQARAARRAKQDLRAKSGFYGGLGAEGLRGRVRRARLGGVPRPTPAGFRAEGALRDSIVSGGAQRAEEEALKEANQALEQELATNPDALEDHDDYVIRIARAGPGANVFGRVRSEADWRAAVEKMYQYGGPNNRIFEQLHTEAMARPNNDPVRAQWEKITNALAPQILPKFPFIHKDRDYGIRDTDLASPTLGALGDMSTTVSQLTPESFTKNGIEGEAVETILGHLSTLVREGDVRANPTATAGQIARRNQARGQIATMYSLFNQTVTNEATRGNVNPVAGRAMMAAAGANPTELARMNAERRRVGGPGVPEIDAPVINDAIVTSTDPDMPRAISSILANVRPDGTPR